MATAEPTEKLKIQQNLNVKPPLMYKVIYVNDNVTTMEFVVESLVTIFEKSRSEAEDIMMTIHEEGSAVVVILPYELAEQKGVEVTVLARNNGFPLTVRLEPAEGS
jgi:ATP-dependent Clp protease adaptor protein ClpS